MSGLVSSLWSWHDLVVGVLHCWEPLGIAPKGGAHSSLADELAMSMSLAWSDGDIVRRMLRADDDRWVLAGSFRRGSNKGQLWVDEVATLHRAARRIHALALELELSDPDEGAWWLGVAAELSQALAEYVPMSRDEVEAELAGADAHATLIGEAMLEQLELLEFMELPFGVSGLRPVVLGEVVSAERLASRDPYRVVLPIPSGVMDVARTWCRQNAFAPLVGLSVGFPFSSWIPRYLPKRWLPMGWYVGRSDLREVWCLLVSRESLFSVVSEMADLISSDMDSRICCATSDRMLWGHLAEALRALEVPL